MSLTHKQEAFCQAVANGSSQSDAYRASYSSSKMTAKQVHEEASKLAANPKIAQRLASLKAEIAEKCLWTREDSVKTLIGIIGEAECKASDKTAAVKVLNDMHGYNAPTKSEVAISGGLVLIPAKNG